VKRSDDPAGRSVLGDVAVAARPEDRADQLRAPVDAEGDDRESRGLGAEPRDRLGAVGVRQVEIAEDDVGLRVLEQSDRLAARRGEPDDDQPLALEQGADAELHDGMVLYREYAQARSAPCASPDATARATSAKPSACSRSRWSAEITFIA